MGMKGGEKGGAEFEYELPLIEIAAGGKQMVVWTDTGETDNAAVIGVQLGDGGSEIIVLTGVPWKYITKWHGSLGVGERFTPDQNPDAAAARSKELGLE